MLCYIKDNNLVSAILEPKKGQEEKYRELERKAAPSSLKIHKIGDFDEKFFSSRYHEYMGENTCINNYIGTSETYFGTDKLGLVNDDYVVRDKSIIFNQSNYPYIFSMKALYPTITLSFLSNKEHHDNNLLTMREGKQESCKSFALNINLMNMLGENNSIELLESCFSAQSEESKKILLYHCIEELAIFCYELLPCVDISVEDTYNLSKIENYSDSIRTEINRALPIAEGNTKVLNIINANKKL